MLALQLKEMVHIIENAIFPNVKKQHVFFEGNVNSQNCLYEFLKVVIS